MKKAMIIGSVHTDLIQYVTSLPKGNEEAEVLRSDTRLAGAGYEAACLFKELSFPFDVISDPGVSVYGEYARKEAETQGIPLIEGGDEIGGCTFTLIDPKGMEGVFCVDGSEYHFSLAQVYDIDPDEYGCVIIDGEMLASNGSEEIIDLLNEMEVPVYLSIGNRLSEIRKDVLEALYAFEPLLITKDSDVNEIIAEKRASADEAARMIQSETKAPVILLLTEGNALYMDDKDSWIASGNTNQNTSRWCAGFAAARLAGVDLQNAMVFANECSKDKTAETMKQRLAGMILHR